MQAEYISTVFTIDELAAYLKISKSTLYELAQEGSIPGQKVGKHWRFHKTTVDGKPRRPRSLAPSTQPSLPAKLHPNYRPSKLRQPRPNNPGRRTGHTQANTKAARR